MLDIVPVSLAEANAFVERYHRHHRPVVGHKFSIGATDGEKIVGVAIVGRPVSRYLDDGMTLEVTRCCTDGTRNENVCESGGLNHEKNDFCAGFLQPWLYAGRTDLWCPRGHDQGCD